MNKEDEEFEEEEEKPKKGRVFGDPVVFLDDW